MPPFKHLLGDPNEGRRARRAHGTASDGRKKHDDFEAKLLGFPVLGDRERERSSEKRLKKVDRRRRGMPLCLALLTPCHPALGINQKLPAAPLCGSKKCAASGSISRCPASGVRASFGAV